MNYRKTSSQTGAVLPLIAVSMTLLLVSLAFSIDLGMITVAKNQLQNTADSAVLAGIVELIEDGLANDPPTQSESSKAAARYWAIDFAQKNTVAGELITEMKGSDVVTMAYDPHGMKNFQYHNTLEVTVRRSAEFNGPLGLFLGAFTGVNEVELSARARATIDDRISGFNEGPLLPFTLHENDWDPDQEIKLEFTVKGNDVENTPGNFGWINYGVAGDRETWILDGFKSSDLPEGGALIGGTMDIDGGTGMAANYFKKLLDSLEGKERILPLHSGTTGSGGNLQFIISGWVGVEIINVNYPGSGSGNDNGWYIVMKKGTVEMAAEHIISDPNAPSTGGAIFTYYMSM